MDVRVCVYTEQTPFKSAHTLSSNSTPVKKNIYYSICLKIKSVYNSFSEKEAQASRSQNGTWNHYLNFQLYSMQVSKLC